MGRSSWVLGGIPGFGGFVPVAAVAQQYNLHHSAALLLDLRSPAHPRTPPHTLVEVVVVVVAVCSSSGGCGSNQTLVTVIIIILYCQSQAYAPK